MLRPEHLAHRPQSRLVPEPPRHQRHQRQQHHAHGTQPPPYPPHSAGQLNIRPDLPSRLLDARSCRHLGLHDGHYLLDLVEASREPTRQAVRQQAERGVSRRTIPARDLRPGRLFPRVRPVPGKTAATTRMQRAAIQACLSPVFLPNVVLAGERRWVAQLHRPLARTAPTVAGLYSCLWVFLRTGPMPITNPSFTHPPLPAKFNATPSRYPPPSQKNQRWPTSGRDRRWITRLRETQQRGRGKRLGEPERDDVNGQPTADHPDGARLRYGGCWADKRGGVLHGDERQLRGADADGTVE
jgi:hypothetical protein